MRQAAVATLAVSVVLVTAALSLRLDWREFIQWLGKFHPPVVGFPTALLIAATAAELFLMVTRKPLFDAASRFCVWCGVITAVVAAVLGWFFGGFQLTDEEWEMTIHRWLGTATAVWGGLVLVLSERSHRTGSVGARTWFRLALFLSVALVSVCGFFGGALIYGLDHYAW